MAKTFSFSKIQIYTECPKQYHFAYVLKLPRVGKYYYSYGTTMHKTLENLYKPFLEKNSTNAQQGLFDTPQKIDQPVVEKKIGEMVSLEKLLEMYDKYFIEAWYETPVQRDSFYKRGVESLTALYDSIKGEYSTAIELEKSFDLKIQKNEEIYHVKGIIDRIDEHEDGIEIIDYKSGKRKEFPDTNKEQLLVYALALKQNHEISRGKEVKKLTFYYIDQNVKEGFEPSETELEDVKHWLITIIDKIKNGEFDADPEISKCTNCDYRNVCEDSIL